jgi:hypothetical protein
VWTVGFDAEAGALEADPKRITDISTEADGELWSPDGKNMIFVSEVYPESPDDACNKARKRRAGEIQGQGHSFHAAFLPPPVAFTRQGSAGTCSSCRQKAAWPAT